MAQGDRAGTDVWAGLRLSLSDFAVWAQREVTAADGVGVTVVVGGRSVFAGSNGFTELVDAVQYGIGEGPCLSAVETATPVRSTTIGSAEQRWPRFAPSAAGLGLRSSASAPVHNDERNGEVIGSLNLYGRAGTTLDTLDTAALIQVAAALRGRLSSARTVAVAAAVSRALRAAAPGRS